MTGKELLSHLNNPNSAGSAAYWRNVVGKDVLEDDINQGYIRSKKDLYGDMPDEYATDKRFGLLTDGEVRAVRSARRKAMLGRLAAGTLGALAGGVLGGVAGHGLSRGSAGGAIAGSAAGMLGGMMVKNLVPEADSMQDIVSRMRNDGGSKTASYPATKQAETRSAARRATLEKCALAIAIPAVLTGAAGGAVNSAFGGLLGAAVGKLTGGRFKDGVESGVGSALPGAAVGATSGILARAALSARSPRLAGLLLGISGLGHLYSPVAGAVKGYIGAKGGNKK